MNPNPNLFCTNCGPSFPQGSIQPMKNIANHRPPINQGSFVGYGPHFNQQGPMNPQQFGPQFPNNQVPLPMQNQRAYNQQNRATRRAAGNAQGHPGHPGQAAMHNINTNMPNVGFPQNRLNGQHQAPNGFGLGPSSGARGNRQVENPVSAGFVDPHFYGPNPNNYSTSNPNQNLKGASSVLGGQQFSGYGEQNGLIDKNLRQMSGASTLDNMLQNTNHLVQRYRHQEMNPQEINYGKVQMYEAQPF